MKKSTILTTQNRSHGILIRAVEKMHLVGVAACLALTFANASYALDVAGDSVWPENVADDIFTLTIPGVGTVPYLHNGAIYDTDWIWSGGSYIGPAGTTHIVNLTLDGGETAPNLSKLGIWLGDSDYGHSARDTASVAFSVNGSQVGATQYRSLSDFLPPDDTGTAQTNNTGGQYVFAEVNGSFPAVTDIQFTLISADFESPRVGEVVAIEQVVPDAPIVAGDVIHVDIFSNANGDGGLFAGTGANGTGGTWNTSSTDTGSSLLKSSGVASEVDFLAEDWDGNWNTGVTEHANLEDALFDDVSINATLTISDLDDSLLYDLYIYAGFESGIYKADGKEAKVTYQGFYIDPDFAAGAPLAVYDDGTQIGNTGLLQSLSPTGGQITVTFETNPEGVTYGGVSLSGFTLVAIPEPSSWALLTSGLLGLFLYARRRKR